MKKLVLLFTLLCVLASASVAHAVTLQQGWYAQFEYVMLSSPMTVDNGGHSCAWYPASTLGQSGRLLVEEGSRPSARGRKITVTETAEFASGVIFEDWGSFNSAYPYDFLQWGWTTNYDATKLQLGVYWRHPGWNIDQLIQSQTIYGYKASGGEVGGYGFLQPGDSIGFKLVVVPEPSGLIALSGGVLLAIGAVRNRLRK